MLYYPKIYIWKSIHNRVASKELCLKIIFETMAVKYTEMSTYVDKNIYGETFIGVEKQAKN